MKAALIAKIVPNMRVSSQHDLNQLTHHLSDETLEQLTKKLQNDLGFVGQMRYPDRHPYPKVPHDVYDEVKAEKGLSTTEILLNHVNQKYLHN